MINTMLLTKSLRLLVFMVSLPVGGLAAADAEQEEVDALYKSVITMMNQITELEARVAKLESGSSQASSAPTSIAPIPIASSKAWWLRSNWSKLRAGMSEGRVKQILGPPTEREVNTFGWVTLKYSGPNAQGIYLTGNVEFFDEDQIPSKSSIKPPAFE